MLQDQGGEEMNCLPWAVVPRSGLHRQQTFFSSSSLSFSSNFLRRQSTPLARLHQDAESQTSPSRWELCQAAWRREQAVQNHPRSELRGSGTGSLWHRRNTRPPPPDFRRDYSSQNAGRGRAGLGRAVLPRGMLGDVVLSPLPSAAAAVGEVREGWSSCCTTSRVISSVNSRLLSPL